MINRKLAIVAILALAGGTGAAHAGEPMTLNEAHGVTGGVGSTHAGKLMTLNEAHRVTGGASAAHTDEPMILNDAQMDQVTGGAADYFLCFTC